MTEQEVLNRCRSEYPTRQTGREPVFIYDENSSPVGVYFPKRRKGFWCLGFVFVVEECRRKGYALQTVDTFRRSNPGMLWYAKRDHEASHKLALLAGLKFVGCEKSDGAVYDIYQDAYVSKLVAA